MGIFYSSRVSVVSALGAYFFTDSIPLVQLSLVVYPSLLTITSPFGAFKWKYHSPSFVDFINHLLQEKNDKMMT